MRRSASSNSEFCAILADPGSSLAALQRVLSEADSQTVAGTRSTTVRFGISSNVTIDLMAVYLKRYASMHGVKLSVHQGNYDDPVGDMERFVELGLDHVLLLPFFDNLVPAFEAQLPTLTADRLDACEAVMRNRYRLALTQGLPMQRIFFCSLHGFSRQPRGDGLLCATLHRFNAALRKETAVFSNVLWLDMEELIESVGQTAALDRRFYYRAKAPYSTRILDRVAERVSMATRGFGTYFYKVLVLDCDNTLWGGIIGEERIDGIQLDPYQYPGNIFWRVQQQLLALERNGILLCLCSKNNLQDVDEALATHPYMVLRDSNFVIKKVNWRDKVENLRELAAELNLGLDSFVLLDDSEFECAAVRAQLPMVTSVLVPRQLPDYPAVVEAITDMFLAGGITTEGRGKTAQYHQQANSQKLEAICETREAYLASLCLKIRLSRNDFEAIPRISELSCKSNQFNLTTRRYTEAELRILMRDTKATVYSLGVSDIFGDSGMTGVAVLRYAHPVATVEAFLLSCRILGRGLEFALWGALLRDAATAGITTIEASLLPTARNGQVADLYEQLGLKLTHELDGKRFFRGELALLTPPLTPWIEISNTR